jgi:CII-binding regulator of phage lambda lysogenization HflD
MDEKINRKLDEQKKQLEQIQGQIREMSSKINSMEIDVKEVIRGLGIIYNSVDELEPKLLAERVTK